MTFPFASLTAWLALAAYAGLSAFPGSRPWLEHSLAARAQYRTPAGGRRAGAALSGAVRHPWPGVWPGPEPSTVMWLTVLIYWTASFFTNRRPNLPGADGGAWRGASAAAAGLSTMIFTSRPCCCNIAMSLLAYSLLRLPPCLAVMMLVLDHAALSSVIRQMPFWLALELKRFRCCGRLLPAGWDGVFRVLFSCEQFVIGPTGGAARTKPCLR